MITRDKDEQLHCIINACAHRGAMLCRRKTDNRITFTCPFHGWTFRNSGELLKVKDGRHGAYPEGFNKEGSHDLTKVARFESYRGFLFGSLNPDVKPLEDHLGDATKVVDSIVNQSPDGLEFLRGASTYTTMTMDAGKWGKQKGGFYSFEHGHLLLWQERGNPKDRPLSADKTEVTICCIAPVGESKENRANRIRQYEDFFSASGMATPADLKEFRSCNKTYWAKGAQWNDMARAMEHEVQGPDEQAKALGMDDVLASGVKTEDEGLYPIQHGYWHEAMESGLQAEEAAEAEAAAATS
ncbi:Benzoate 1,2-dioxygenase alpha subunit [Kocuria palustris PEL]|uniref:Benzoate 1,2-dioxygenase alpha subunit n=1 Tax=Kocuria palustris PEL TaxID=1236550 RepID=M2YFN9_9MICC|nr:Benzoate 1,2-dioxygenase alpha subunit [Kocuria palustris PEL]